MKLDAELELWRDQWQASPEAPELSSLRKRVARESLYMRILLTADILVTLVIGGGTIALALRNPRPASAILAAATWLFIAGAWIFGLSNRKDAWSPSASTTESGPLSSTLITILTLITLILAAALIIYRKKKRTDLSYLLQLQRDLTAAE
jgi:NADH:ubiquinone oxidoreductase subunit 2 (subunit N)